MKTISEKDVLICIYCLATQEHTAIDYIPFNPNLQGIAKPSYSTSVQEEKCTECDSTLYLKLNDNHTISIANTPYM